MSCNCSGNCNGCSGCRGSLFMSAEEIVFLEEMAQVPFFPIARKVDSDDFICPDKSGMEETIILLEKKGLISLDYDKPLNGYDYRDCKGYPVRGSGALTARGIQILELVQIQGVEDTF